jgi:hypothetical protein
MSISITSPTARLHQAASSANLAYFDSDLQNYGENSAGALGVFQRVGLVVHPAVGCVISINGIETSDPGASAADVLGSLSVAASLAGTATANIALEELILYPAFHSPAQRAQMDAYLAAL